MQANILRVVRHATITAASALVLALAGGASYAQQQINLTAGPSTVALPDGSAVPMWGYSCGTAVTGSTATCANLNPLATGWSPVVITVPTGQDLTINLTNSLSFGANSVPTSLVIVGQLGGGLGTSATSTPSPDHTNAQPLTWPIAGTPPGSPAAGVGTAPAQGPRVQSFATEVAAGATAALTWKAPRPGTYLIESGTHPSIQGPMGLYGILVVTSAPTTAAPAGTAYPGVTYNAELPLLLSEIDPVQNKAVNAAVNAAAFSETLVWSGQPGSCGNPSYVPSATTPACYPPAVNYTPLYYLFNGVAFDKTHAATSLFPASPATGVTGSVLVRLVNAGLRMHVPSIVGALTNTPAVSGFALIAEDGNPLPGIARVQSEVFLAAGKPPTS
jgi:FtsP/CotA-like multicopper oxidase with cupredoxin domain